MRRRKEEILTGLSLPIMMTNTIGNTAYRMGCEMSTGGGWWPAAAVMIHQVTLSPAEVAAMRA